MSPKSYYIVYGTEDLAKESIKRMLRIGYTNIAGYCCDPLEVVGKSLRIYKPDLIFDLDSQDYQFLDVRKPAEWQAGHVDQAIHIELGNLFD